MVGVALGAAVGTGVGAVVAVALGGTMTVGGRIVDGTADTGCGVDWHAVSVAKAIKATNKYFNIFLFLGKNNLRQAHDRLSFKPVNDRYYNTNR